MRCGWYCSHPLADLFPEMPDEDLRSLAAAIKSDGFDPSRPVVMHEGKVLDGRHRYRAARIAGIPHHEIPTVDWSGECGSPVAFVMAANFHRRHLTQKQRIQIVIEMEEHFKVGRGGDRRSPGSKVQDCTFDNRKPKLDAMAEAAGCSRRTIANALAKKYGRDKKRPEEAQDMAADGVTEEGLATVLSIAPQPPDPVDEFLEEARSWTSAQRRRAIDGLTLIDRTGGAL